MARYTGKRTSGRTAEETEQRPVRTARSEQQADMPQRTARRPAKRQKKMPLWAVFFIDILITGIALVIFALFHHVIPSLHANDDESTVIQNTSGNSMIAEQTPEAETEPEIETTETVETESEAAGSETGEMETSEASGETVEDTEAAETEETPAEEQTAVTELTPAEKFADKFTAEVVQTETHYSSPSICIDITEHTSGEGKNAVVWHEADIYLADVRCFQSYFAGNKYTHGAYAYSIEDLSKSSNALVAINGDYFSYQSGTLVLRNGVLHRSPSTDADICVLYYDGTMKTYRAAEVNTQEEIEAALTNAWQGWSFGPALLDGEGNVYENLAKYTTLAPKNPRTGIGYYEPGHYCFVVVDGRSNASAGADIETFAQIFADLGCKYAYNLDGGGSSRMAFNAEVVSVPSESRKLPDIILITEYEGSIGQQVLEGTAE